MSHEHTDARPALSVPPLRLLSGAAALRDELEHTLAAAEGLHDAAEALTRELLQGRALQPGPTLERARAARRSLSRAGRWLGSAQACAQRSWGTALSGANGRGHDRVTAKARA